MNIPDLPPGYRFIAYPLAHKGIHIYLQKLEKKGLFRRELWQTEDSGYAVSDSPLDGTRHPENVMKKLWERYLEENTVDDATVRAAAEINHKFSP